MNKIRKNQKDVDFQEYLKDQLKNARFQKYYKQYDKELKSKISRA
jgi:arsenate reductase-like glutaredoxin family protein